MISRGTGPVERVGLKLRKEVVDKTPDDELSEIDILFCSKQGSRQGRDWECNEERWWKVLGSSRIKKYIEVQDKFEVGRRGRNSE